MVFVSFIMEWSTFITIKEIVYLTCCRSDHSNIWYPIWARYNHRSFLDNIVHFVYPDKRVLPNWDPHYTLADTDYRSRIRRRIESKQSANSAFCHPLLSLESLCSPRSLLTITIVNQPNYNSQTKYVESKYLQTLERRRHKFVSQIEFENRWLIFFRTIFSFQVYFLFSSVRYYYFIVSFSKGMSLQSILFSQF